MSQLQASAQQGGHVRPKATIDFESRSLCDIAAGSWIYSHHPTTQVYCLAYKLPGGSARLWHRAHPRVGIRQSPFPQDLADFILAGELIEAHNSGFEYDMWNFCFRVEFPEFPVLGFEQMRCSAAKAAQFALPRSLEDACDALLTVRRKNLDGKKVMLRVSKLPGKHDLEALTAKVEMGLLDVNDLPWNENPDDLRTTWAYCVDDVEAEESLSDDLPPMSEKELAMWQMDQRMNLRGVKCDLAGAEIAIGMADDEADRLNARLRELTGGAVPKGSSRIKLRTWANNNGLPLQNTQADHIKEVLASDLGKRLRETEEGRTVFEAMEICMDVNQTSTKKYEQMIEMAFTDGRLRDLMLYYGAARTGRWSGKGVQPHNFLRGFSSEMEFAWEWIHRGDAEDLRFWFGSVMKALAKATRGALIADDGKDLMVADYAAIEARVLPWLANDQDALDIFRSGRDVYLKMAGDIYEADPEKAEFNAFIKRLNADPTNKALLKEIKKLFPVERQMGKKAILGLGFQMGAEKFDDECAAEDPPIDMPREFFMKVVKTYREVSFPMIASFWDELNAAAVEAILNPGRRVDCRMVAYKVRGEFLRCLLPSGRCLSYHKPSVRQQETYVYEAKSKQGKKATIRVNVKAGEEEYAVWKRALLVAKASEKTFVENARLDVDRRSQDAIFFWGVDQKTKQYVRMTTYGGSLAENVTQATARDLMGEAMLRCDATEEYDMLLSVHDELIAECDEDKGDVQEFEHMMAALPEWVPQDNSCPVAAEGWRGKRYKK